MIGEPYPPRCLRRSERVYIPVLRLFVLYAGVERWCLVFVDYVVDCHVTAVNNVDCNVGGMTLRCYHDVLHEHRRERFVALNALLLLTRCDLHALPVSTTLFDLTWTTPLRLFVAGCAADYRRQIEFVGCRWLPRLRPGGHW